MPDKGHDRACGIARWRLPGHLGDVSGPLGSRRQEHPRHGCQRLQRRAGRIEEPLPVKMVALWQHQGLILPAIQVGRMHPIATDDASEAVLPHAGENLLINKATGQQRAAAPTGSFVLTSVPFGWRGIIVEQHRLPPMELAEHSVIGHGISVNVGAQPGTFAWTRGRERMERQADQPWSLSNPHAW